MNIATRPISRRRPTYAALVHTLTALLLASLAAGARAQGLPDPTRPPASVSRAVPGGPALAAAPVLQSILIVRDQRSAVISGETVTVGARYGDARVIRITESEVVLKGSEGVTTLMLYPHVEKRMRHAHPSARSPRATERRDATPRTKGGV